MKLQNTTIALLVMAVLLSGGFYWADRQNRPPTAQDTPQPQDTLIFTFQEDQIQSFQIQRGERVLSFAKGKTTRANTWYMEKPQAGAADEASIAYLLNLLATGKTQTTLTVPTARLAEFGLNQPLATITVSLSTPKTHRLILGKPDFSGKFLYAQADPPTHKVSEWSVLLVPIEFASAVDRPLAEWRSPE
ncbi:hypothetical protein BST81_17635 [Leptolyngbya sp. 'hensonii']|uniref:DUF4340 domain-containing protein n=1 Tax=Leptolyngbya sp. 'hensonii' TaxID=1922337 RepID=UPI00094F57B3|nr:DUF4340 domain-containing protein [Leptolyngbya sp. 'hensonii']OLP17171.1 hypothetical protein BST81_17635 [Leptolyngbya sp. 'hensonii']